MEDEQASRPQELARAAALLGLLLLPAVAGFVVAGASAAVGAVIGGLVGFMASMTSGLSSARSHLPVVVAAAGASIVTAGTLWWALGLALIGGAAGWAYRWGRFTPLALAGLAYSVVQPVDGAGALLLSLVFLLIGAANALILARNAGAPESIEGVVLDPYPAAWTAATLATVAGLAGFVAWQWDDPNAYWLPMTVFILAIPRPGAGLRSRSVARIWGTAAGAVVGGVVTQLGLPLGIPLLLGFAALLVSLVAENLAVAAAGSAAAIVILLTPSGGGLEVAETRLAATVVAVVISGIVLLAVHWVAGKHGWLAADADVSKRLKDLSGQEVGETAK